MNATMIRSPSRSHRNRWIVLTAAIACALTFAGTEAEHLADDLEALSSAAMDMQSSGHEVRELDRASDESTSRMLRRQPRRRAQNDEEDEEDDEEEEEEVEDDSHRLRHGEWHQVEYRGVGHTVLQLDLNEPCAIHLRIVEVGSLGGRIQVRDGPDHIMGLTSQGRSGFCDHSDPDDCYDNCDAASSGEFALEPGPHNVQLRVVSAPYSRGRIAIRIDRELCPEISR